MVSGQVDRQEDMWLCVQAMILARYMSSSRCPTSEIKGKLQVRGTRCEEETWILGVWRR